MISSNTNSTAVINALTMDFKNVGINSLIEILAIFDRVKTNIKRDVQIIDTTMDMIIPVTPNTLDNIKDNIDVIDKEIILLIKGVFVLPLA